MKLARRCVSVLVAPGLALAVGKRRHLCRSSLGLMTGVLTTHKFYSGLPAASSPWGSTPFNWVWPRKALGLWPHLPALMTPTQHQSLQQIPQVMKGWSSGAEAVRGEELGKVPSGAGARGGAEKAPGTRWFPLKSPSVPRRQAAG